MLGEGFLVNGQECIVLTFENPHNNSTFAFLGDTTKGGIEDTLGESIAGGAEMVDSLPKCRILTSKVYIFHQEVGGTKGTNDTSITSGEVCTFAVTIAFAC